MTIVLDHYLDRIGFKGSLNTNLATVSDLHNAHVDAIPFGGADPLFGRPVPLDLPALEAKLVHGRRGGYCFEQSALFKSVLEQIGFTVTGLGARVRWMSPRDAPLGPREHTLLKIDLAEGAYLADVGFGACLMDTPLRLETGIEQRTRMGTFLLTETEGLYALAARRPGGCSSGAGDLEDRLQRFTASLSARMANADRVRVNLQPASGSSAAPYQKLRACARCSTRLPGQIHRRKRTQNWIKLGGNVTQPGNFWRASHRLFLISSRLQENFD